MRIAKIGPNQIVTTAATGGGPGDEAGVWGVFPGGSSKGLAINTDNGDNSFIQCGTVINLDQSIRMNPFPSLPGRRHTIRVSYRAIIPGTHATGLEVRLSALAPDMSLGAGADLTGIILFPAPGPGDDTYHTRDIDLTAPQIANLLPWTFNTWWNFRAGLANTQPYNLSFAQLIIR